MHGLAGHRGPAHAGLKEGDWKVGLAVRNSAKSHGPSAALLVVPYPMDPTPSGTG